MGKIAGFGEVMVRLSPHGYLKFVQAEDFNVNYTGAEANVCVSLSRFGKETEFISRFPDNDITDATLCKLRQYGVGLNHIILGGDRIGLYYLERGASQRPSKVVYDRKYSSISMSKREDYDWEAILDGVDWFHFTGITAALSEEMPAICEDACRVARSKGITVSCDLNYRKNLWTPEQAQAVMRKLIGYVDVLIGNEEDAEKTLGIVPAETDVTEGKLNYGAYKDLAASICKEFGVKKVAFTLRTSISASDNKWAAMLYSGGEAHYSKEYLIHMVDRVGGGDSFAAGLIYALHEGWEAQKAIEFAVAASCLKQTMEQDFNLSSVPEVLHLMEGDGSGRVQR